MSDPKQGPWAQVVRYVSLATLLPLAGLAGYGIGYFLDRAFATHFLGIVFLILGTIGGFIQLIHGLGKE
jgi:F0F1-type ATP synthase assembly protein I